MKTKVARLKTLLNETLSLNLGYPTEGRILDGSTHDQLAELKRLNFPDDYIEFAFYCAAASAPDIHNGYFLHPIGRVIADAQKIEGEENFVVGSDGGGNLFLVNRYGNGVLRASPAGTVDSIVAPSFEAFLDRIILDWEHFRDGADWTYLT